MYYYIIIIITYIYRKDDLKKSRLVLSLRGSPCRYASKRSSVAGWICPSINARSVGVTAFGCLCTWGTSMWILYISLGPSTNWELVKDWWMHKYMEELNLLWGVIRAETISNWRQSDFGAQRQKGGAEMKTITFSIKTWRKRKWNNLHTSIYAK